MLGFLFYNYPETKHLPKNMYSLMLSPVFGIMIVAESQPNQFQFVHRVYG